MTRSDVMRRVIAVGLMSLAAASVYIRLFGPGPVLLRLFPAVVLCCLGYGLGTAGGRRVQRGVGAVIGLCAAVLATVMLGAMTIANQNGDVSPGSFFDGLVRGLGITLGSVVPAPANAETITFAIMLVTYGALVSCLLSTTGLPASSVAPPLVVFIIGLALSQGSTQSALPYAGLLIVSMILALTLLPEGKQYNKIEDGAEFAEVEKTPRPGRSVRAVGVVVSAAVITAISLLLTPALGIGSMRPAFDPHRKENFRPEIDLNGDDVVSLATKWQTVQRENPQDVFTVTGPDIPRSVNWAINDKFDGRVWSSLTTFDQVPPTGIPDPDSNPRFTASGTTSFATAEGLPGPWLPASYRPTNVYPIPARADKEGTLVAGDDKAANKQYTVDYNALAMRSLAPLQTVTAADQPEYGTLRELPRDFPVELQYFAADAMATAYTPYDKLQALAAATSGPEYVEQFDAIRNSLDGQALNDVVLLSKSGTEAQYATAFALMARSQGFPTRLVVGYSTKGKGTSRRVLSTDVIVYPEVQLTKVGWVPFAPGPQDVQRGVPTVKATKVPAPPAPEPTPTPTPKPTKQPKKPKPQPAPAEKGSSVPAIALGVLLVLALLVAWPLLAGRRRASVRASYRSGSPDQQVVGAWAYVRAARRRLGAGLEDSWSPARYAVEPQADPQVSTLAALAEIAMYAPDGLRPQDAQQAWRLADLIVSRTLKSAPLRRRLGWYLVPGISKHAPMTDLAHHPAPA